jgi:hypothetical protein
MKTSSTDEIQHQHAKKVKKKSSILGDFDSKNLGFIRQFFLVGFEVR